MGDMALAEPVLTLSMGIVGAGQTRAATVKTCGTGVAEKKARPEPVEGRGGFEDVTLPVQVNGRREISLAKKR